MTPACSCPLGLAALAALIIPLVIHIARRSEQLPTDFAALRWLRQKPRPRSRLRFDEWPLLILRLLLLALVALWLARPVLFGASDKAAYVAVVPGADAAQGTDHRRRGQGPLARAGLPPTSTTPRPSASAPVASLIRQLDADLPPGAPLTVVVPQVLRGRRRRTPLLSRPVTGASSPAPCPPARPARAVPPLSIRTDASHAAGVRYLQAAAVVVAARRPRRGRRDRRPRRPLPKADRTLIWLGAGTLPPAAAALGRGRRNRPGRLRRRRPRRTDAQPSGATVSTAP
jgi:hypothetical protein